MRYANGPFSQYNTIASYFTSVIWGLPEAATLALILLWVLAMDASGSVICHTRQWAVHAASRHMLCHSGCWWCTCIRMGNFQECLLALRPITDTPWLSRIFSRLVDWFVDLYAHINMSCHDQWVQLDRSFQCGTSKSQVLNKQTVTRVFVWELVELSTWAKKWTGEQTGRYEENNHFICCCYCYYFDCFTCSKLIHRSCLDEIH
jgi:hypothetical protein